MNERLCLGRCGQLLPLTDFHRNRKAPFGRQSRCKQCISKQRRERRASLPPEELERARHRQNENQKRYYQLNPPTKEKQKDRFLQSTYGLTLERYLELERAQGGVCAICNRRCSSGRQLSVDHDHSTGAVRGLLCMKCNRGIGNLGDSADLLRASAKYLDFHNGIKEDRT